LSQHEWPARTPVGSFAPLELDSLGGLRAFDGMRIFEALEQAFVDHGHAARGNGSDSKLRLARRSDLAHNHHIQRRMKRPSDLKGNWKRGERTSRMSRSLACRRQGRERVNARDRRR